MMRSLFGVCVGLFTAVSALAQQSGLSNRDGVQLPYAGTTWRSFAERAKDQLSVRDFGAKCDGVTDDSQAFASALAAANKPAAAAVGTSFAVSTARLLIPAGDCVVSTGLNATTLNVAIEGAGREDTRIRLGVGQYFLTVSGPVAQFTLKGVTISGGAGTLRHTRKAPNVQGHVVIADNAFFDYTGVAIGSLSSDFPYWKILHNIFRGDRRLTSKGVVLPGAAAGAEIRGNSFLADRYNIKVQAGGPNVYIEDNDFVKFQRSSRNPQVDIWIVPKSNNISAGDGQVIRGNKFGNENLSAGDVRILIADEDVGTDAFDKNHSTVASTGFWTGFNIYGNLFSGGAGSTKGIVYSYTPNIEFGRFEHNISSGTQYPYIVEYADAVSFSTDQRLRQSSIFELPIASTTMFEAASTLPANVNPGVALTRDPYGLLNGQDSERQYFTSGFDAGYKAVTITGAASPAGFVSAFVVPTIDAVGGRDASSITYDSKAGHVWFNPNMEDFVVGRAAWLEFDIRQGPVSPIRLIDVQLRTDSGDIAVRRILAVPNHWATIRIPFVPLQKKTALRLSIIGSGYVATVATDLEIGRIRIYHAAEPVSPAALYLQASATYDPPRLAVGSGATATVTVVGAALGDFAICSFGLDVQGIMVTAYVSAADTVACRFQNDSGKPLDLQSATLRARVYRQ